MLGWAWWRNLGYAGLLSVVVAACGHASPSPSPSPAAVAGEPASGGQPAETGATGGARSDAGTPGTGVEAAGSDSSATGSCDCDDGVDCTLDSCDDAGVCSHVPRHFACKAGQYCAAEGCVRGAACAGDTDCLRPDACAVATCDPQQRRCLYAFLDGDGDGHAPLSCGGNDCNDDKVDVNPGVVETCNGIDDDCDGVTDPSADSGCSDGRSCHAGKCRCDEGKSSCSGQAACVDLQTDAQNCGTCDLQCPAATSCVDAKCVCETGQSLCGSACVDLKTNSNNCGKCQSYCPQGSVCSDGKCGCPANTTDCGTFGPYCVDLSSDSNACGDCGTACMGGSSCQKGTCDAKVEWVRFYGATSLGNRWLHNVSMALDTKENIFVSASLEYESYQELPSPSTTLWSGRDAILKFDSKGNLLWAKPCSTWVDQIAAAGDDVWAVIREADATITIAGQSCKRIGMQTTCMVKLSGADGSVLDWQQVDHAQGFLGLAPKIYADGSGKVWLQETATELTVGANNWKSPAAPYSVYVLPQGGKPLWLVASSEFYRDGTDFIFQQLLSAGDSVDFGGGAVQANKNVSAIVRYASDLTYKSTLLVPSWGKLAPPSQAGWLFVGEKNKPYLQRFAQDGSAGASYGAAPPFYADRLMVGGGRLHVTGQTGLTGGNYEGHSFLSNFASAVASFDETSLKLTNALSFDAELTDNSTDTGIYGAQLVDNGQAMLLAIQFSNGVDFGKEYRFGSSAGGFALAKVKLPAP